MKTLKAFLFLALLMTGTKAMAIEEPKHIVEHQEGPFQIREYPPLVAAEVEVSGDRDQAASAGFRLLAGYIFGGNTKRESIAMTAPVVQAKAQSQSIAMTAPVLQSQTGGTWQVRFVMPSQYTMETLPTPNDSRVQLVAVPSAKVAAVRFSGLASPKDVQRKTAELETFIQSRKLQAIGPPSLARYNPPWTLWFMRRNEVWIPIQTVVP